MNGESRVMLYVTKKTVWLADYSGLTPKTAHIDWDGKDAGPVFQAVKRTLQSPSLKIILGNDLSYVVCFETAQKNPDRESVFETARLEIPEDISEASFDWKIAGRHKTTDTRIIQATAIPSSTLSALSRGARDAGIAIESMMPVPVVLAQMTKFLPPSHMVLWSRYESLAVAASQGIVYGVRDISVNPIQRVLELRDYTAAKFGMPIAHYYIDWPQEFEKTVDMDAFTKQVLVNADASRYSMEPMKFAVQRESEIGRDEDILDIQSTLTPLSGPAETKKEQNPGAVADASDIEVRDVKVKPFGVRWKMFVRDFRALFGLTLLLFAAIGVFSYRYQRKNTQQVPSTVLSASTQQPAAAETPAPVTYSSYTVQVLNGSGVGGEAGAVKTLIAPLGFSSVATGNAGSYAHKKTGVQMKASVPQSVFTAISEKLAAYETTSSGELEPGAAFDIVITVGSRRTN